MAITVSLLGTPTFNTTSGTKTVTATPAVGDLVIIITAHSGNTSTAAPTDNKTGGTYTLVNTAVKATSADTMKVWVRNNLITSATSTVFTHAPGTTTGGGLVVIDCQGGDKAGSSAIVQSAIQSNAAAGTPAPVFGATPNSANAIIGAVFNARNPAALTPRTNYTELYDSGYNTPATGLEVMADNSGETSATITWGGSAGTVFASLVVELEASVTHATTGVLTGQIGSVNGTASRNIPHVTTGILAGQGSSITGSASNFTPHSTSGTLTGQGSTITGDADREPMVLPHTTEGVLVGQSSTVTGSATRFRAHTTTGSLTGQGSTIAGEADREALVIPHVAEGTLVGQGSVVVGSSSRFRAFSSTGVLNGVTSIIDGTATDFKQYDSSGSLVGQNSVITGDADHVSNTHESNGDLTGDGSLVSGSATRYKEFLSSGQLAGQGSSIVGYAEVTQPIHDATGDLVGQSSVIVGKASKSAIEVTGAKKLRAKPSVIIVEVDGKDYRVPETQLQAFLDALQQKVESSLPVKKKRKKRAKQKQEVVEVKELPQIVIKSAPINIVPQIQSRIDEANTIIANSFSKALQQYVQNIELENVKIQLAKKQAIEDEEEWLLMLL